MDLWRMAFMLARSVFLITQSAGRKKRRKKMTESAVREKLYGWVWRWRACHPDLGECFRENEQKLRRDRCLQ